MTTPGSGAQYRLRHGGYEAVMASVRASLRTLTRHGRDLVVRFVAHELRPGCSGAILAPWPNRIAGGGYTADNPERRLSRLGLAVESMTCPPDAFNSGTDVIHLEPGRKTSVS